MKAGKLWFGKLILFGEYTIIKGSRAIAVPAKFHQAQWAYSPEKIKQQKLPQFSDWLIRLQKEDKLLFPLDARALLSALQKGLYLQSDIPVGYGAGSSGALCASIYDTFALDKLAPGDENSYVQLKGIFAQMEQFFHGSSSGTDPLVSYINQAILIHADGKIKKAVMPELPEAGSPFFLLDSGIKRSTSPLVKLFLEKCEKASYNQKITELLLPTMNKAIDLLLEGNWNGLQKQFQLISRLQYQLFPEMIPEAVSKHWQRGLQSEAFSLKLCGAGGGGYLLGFKHADDLSGLSDFPLRTISFF